MIKAVQKTERSGVRKGLESDRTCIRVWKDRQGLDVWRLGEIGRKSLGERKRYSRNP